MDVERWTLDVERWTLDVGRWTTEFRPGELAYAVFKGQRPERIVEAVSVNSSVRHKVDGSASLKHRV